MRQLNDKPGLASFLTVVLLSLAPAALRAGDQPSGASRAGRPPIGRRRIAHRASPSTARPLRVTAARGFPGARAAVDRHPRRRAAPEPGAVSRGSLLEGARAARVLGDRRDDRLRDHRDRGGGGTLSWIAAGRDRRPEQSRGWADRPPPLAPGGPRRGSSASTTARARCRTSGPRARRSSTRSRTWALVRALVTETDIERIFVDRSLMRVLYDEAVAEGEDVGWLAAIFGRTSDKGIIQHERRHKDHLHARFYNRRAQEAGRLVYPTLVETGVAPPPVREAPRERRRDARQPGAPLRHERPRDPRGERALEHAAAGGPLLHDPDPQGSGRQRAGDRAARGACRRTCRRGRSRPTERPAALREQSQQQAEGRRASAAVARHVPASRRLLDAVADALLGRERRSLRRAGSSSRRNLRSPRS